MKNFNAKRFALVLRYDFALGRKSLIFASLGMLLGYLLFFFLGHTNYPMPFRLGIDLRMKYIAEQAGYIGVVGFYVYLLACVSAIFRREQSKQRLTATLMLPASALEKFVSRWVYVMVISVVGGLLMFFVADAVHLAYSYLRGLPVVSATTYFWKAFPHVSSGSHPDVVYNIIFGYAILTAIHAFFLLGGIVFKKYNIVATGIVQSVLGFLLMWLYAKLGVRSWFSAIASNLVWTTVDLLLIVVFTGLTYRLFRRWQIETHKYVNL